MWGQRALASNINQAARDMLALDPDKDRNLALDDSQTNDTTETGSVTLNQLKRKKGEWVYGSACVDAYVLLYL